MKIDQWYTETLFVNIDTGEQITKDEALRGFVFIKKTKKIKIDETAEKTIGIRTFIIQCRKSQQGKLFE